MKVYAFMFVFCLLVSGRPGFSQGQDFQTMLDRGKAEFKLQAKKDTSDYTHAYKILLEAVKLQPDNAEARYFLGYAIDRINSNDGNSLHLSGRDLAIQASEQYEIINRLEPKYSGEMVVLDPYSKISSIWGSLAMAYITRHQTDSAKWAFMQGKKRGGFINPVLAYNRQLLTCCDKNAILICFGDNLTIPLWYLQEMEHFRADVIVIDANLLNASWYPKFLKHEKGLSITYSDEQLDSLKYIEWKPTTVRIQKDDKVFAWKMRPTYYDAYILRGDRILLDVFKQGFFTRPFYFASGSDSTNNLFLSDHLGNEGILNKVLPAQADSTASHQACLKNLASYSIDGVFASEIVNSSDAVTLLNTFRWTYYLESYRLYVKGDIEGAKKLLADMDRKFDEARLPYFSQAFSDAFDKFRQALQ